MMGKLVSGNWGVTMNRVVMKRVLIIAATLVILVGAVWWLETSRVGPSTSCSTTTATVTTTVTIGAKNASATKQYGAKITDVYMVPDPANVGQGSRMIFTIVVANTGSSDISSGKTQVKMYDPGGKVVSRSQNFTELVAGTEMMSQISYTLPVSASLGAWTYDAYVYRDYLNSTRLLDELKGRSFTVQPAVRIGEIVSVTDSPDPVDRGENVTFTIKLKNTGNTIWANAKITIEIYRPNGSLATTSNLPVKDVVPNTEYSYDISWLVASYRGIGTYRYDVFLYYGTDLIDSYTGNTIDVS